LKVLVACEESQRVCAAFREIGHEAYSCDILPTSGEHPEWHIQEDVRSVIDKDWDMVIAFPPCIYLTAAGACRMYPTKGNIDGERFKKSQEAKEFFYDVLKFKLSKNCSRKSTATKSSWVTKRNTTYSTMAIWGTIYEINIFMAQRITRTCSYA